MRQLLDCKLLDEFEKVGRFGPGFAEDPELLPLANFEKDQPQAVDVMFHFVPRPLLTRGERTKQRRMAINIHGRAAHIKRGGAGLVRTGILEARDERRAEVKGFSAGVEENDILTIEAFMEPFGVMKFE